MLNRKQNKFWKIQAIYAFLQTYEYDEVVEDFKLNIDEDEDKSEMLKDFESIVKYLEDIIALIQTYLPSNWQWTNLNLMERAVLIAGLYDLQHSTNAKQVINDYVGLVRIFGEDESAPFVKANLENMSKDIAANSDV